MIRRINESKILTKRVSCKCKCKFDNKKCNLNQKQNDDKCRCECKNQKKKLCVQKNYIWNPSTRTCENGRYTRSIIDDSVITCDEIIEETNTVPTKRT